METEKQSGPWNGLGKLSPHNYYVSSLGDKTGIKLSPHGYYVFSLVDKSGIHEICNLKLNSPWRSTSIILNQGVLHLWSIFCGSSLNRWWVFLQTSSGLTHTWTHRQVPAMTTPEGQNWPQLKNQHVTHLVDKMSTYNMDLASIVEDTEQTQFGLQRDGQMDWQIEKVKPAYTPSTLLVEGIMKYHRIYQNWLSKASSSFWMNWNEMLVFRAFLHLVKLNQTGTVWDNETYV